MRTWSLLLVSIITVSLHGCIDNRFFIPYITTDPYFLSPDDHAYLRSYTFAGSAYEAYASGGAEIPVFDFARNAGQNQYDQIAIDQALQDTGRITTSLIPSEWVSSLPRSTWRMDGHIEMQGFDIAYDYPVTSWLRLGGSWYWMVIASRLELLREHDRTTSRAFNNPGNEQTLFDIKADSHDALGITSPLFIEVEPGDLDVYARFSWNAEYAYKFQYIDIGLQTGLLLPTSEQRDIDNPASIPAGGNNHTGIYVSCNPHMILKDNIRAGWDARVIKRFSKCLNQRMPIGNEPIAFGAVVGEAEVDPGVTVGFAPYLAFEELREGFGLLLRYAIVGHDKDVWRNITLPQGVSGVDRNALQETSSWASEHITAQAFYDFGHGQASHEPSARLMIKGEAPIEWLAARRTTKMYGISVALEGSF